MDCRQGHACKQKANINHQNLPPPPNKNLPPSKTFLPHYPSIITITQRGGGVNVMAPIPIPITFPS